MGLDHIHLLVAWRGCNSIAIARGSQPFRASLAALYATELGSRFICPSETASKHRVGLNDARNCIWESAASGSTRTTAPAVTWPVYGSPRASPWMMCASRFVSCLLTYRSDVPLPVCRWAGQLLSVSGPAIPSTFNPFLLNCLTAGMSGNHRFHQRPLYSTPPLEPCLYVSTSWPLEP